MGRKGQSLSLRRLPKQVPKTTYFSSWVGTAGSLGTQVYLRQMGTLGTRWEPLGVTRAENEFIRAHIYPFPAVGSLGTSFWNLQTFNDG